MDLQEYGPDRKLKNTGVALLRTRNEYLLLWVALLNAFKSLTLMGDKKKNTQLNPILEVFIESVTAESLATVHGAIISMLFCDLFVERIFRTWYTFERRLQNISIIFCLNRWFISAYANGFTAALNMIMVWAIGMARGPISYEITSAIKCITESIPQQIANITVTTTTINVTRFRTFRTPWQKKIALLNN